MKKRIGPKANRKVEANGGVFSQKEDSSTKTAKGLSPKALSTPYAGTNRPNGTNTEIIDESLCHTADTPGQTAGQTAGHAQGSPSPASQDENPGTNRPNGTNTEIIDESLCHTAAKPWTDGEEDGEEDDDGIVDARLATLRAWFDGIFDGLARLPDGLPRELGLMQCALAATERLGASDLFMLIASLGTYSPGGKKASPETLRAFWIAAGGVLGTDLGPDEPKVERLAAVARGVHTQSTNANTAPLLRELSERVEYALDIGGRVRNPMEWRAQGLAEWAAGWMKERGLSPRKLDVSAIAEGLKAPSVNGRAASVALAIGLLKGTRADEAAYRKAVKLVGKALKDA